MVGGCITVADSELSAIGRGECREGAIAYSKQGFAGVGAASSRANGLTEGGRGPNEGLQCRGSRAVLLHGILALVTAPLVTTPLVTTSLVSNVPGVIADAERGDIHISCAGGVVDRHTEAAGVRAGSEGEDGSVGYGGRKLVPRAIYPGGSSRWPKISMLGAEGCRRIPERPVHRATYTPQISRHDREHPSRHRGAGW